MKKYDEEVHPVGEGLSDDVRVLRVKVLSCFLRAGVAINKIDHFRDILEEISYRLTSSRHLTEMIPIVRHQEEEKMQGEINGKKVSVIFDGTTHVCEATVIVLRSVDDDWCIKQRVAQIMLLAKPMSAEELARELILCLSTELGITGDRLIASMHDRASVNNAAMRTLKIIIIPKHN